MATSVRSPSARPWTDAIASVRPSEAFLICFLFVLPINTEAIAFPAFTQIKIGLGGLAAFSATLAFISARKNASGRDYLRAQVVGWLPYLYVSVLILATLRPLPGRRYELLLEFLVGTAALIIAERCRRGSALKILLVVSVGHLVFAVVSGDRAPSTLGFERLTGASHAITLGFESGMVLLWTVSQLKRWRDQKFLLSALLFLSLYTWYSAFSRTALIGTSAALVLLWVFSAKVRTPAATVVRLVAASMAVASVLYLLGGALFREVTGDNPAGFASATGRTSIWSNVWAFRNDFIIRGFGFGVLQDMDGPDTQIYRATEGLPVENAVLNSVMMAGVLGGLLYTLIIVNLLVRAVSMIRHGESAFPLAASVLLITDTMFSVAASEAGIEWYWLLAILTVVHVPPPNLQRQNE